MKVLLINGSPHAHGCTYTALSAVADELNKADVETEIVHVGHKDIRGCIVLAVISVASWGDASLTRIWSMKLPRSSRRLTDWS